MFPSRPPGPPNSAPPFKSNVLDFCDRIKEDFNCLQAHNHTLKLECEKLASEKAEMQRQYVMYYEMSYGLNIEMHKQSEIAKRLNTLCTQIIPHLPVEQQQQVAPALERAKQVTTNELSHIIGQQFQVQNLMNVHNSSAAAVASAGGAPGGQTHPVQAAMAAALAAANLPLGGNSGGFTPSTSSGNGSNPILALNHHPGLFPQAATSSSHGHLRPPPHKEQQRADLASSSSSSDRNRTRQNSASPAVISSTEKHRLSDQGNYQHKRHKSELNTEKLIKIHNDGSDQSDTNVIVDDDDTAASTTIRHDDVTDEVQLRCKTPPSHHRSASLTDEQQRRFTTSSSSFCDVIISHVLIRRCIKVYFFT